MWRSGEVLPCLIVVYKKALVILSLTSGFMPCLQHGVIRGRKPRTEVLGFGYLISSRSVGCGVFLR